MVVHDESAHADACRDPTQTHDCDDKDFCALVHLQIPHHDGGNGYNDQVHEDAEGATRQDERPRIDTLPTGHNSAISANFVHARFGPDVADGFALNYVDERCCDSVQHVQPKRCVQRVAYTAAIVFHAKKEHDD